MRSRGSQANRFSDVRGPGDPDRPRRGRSGCNANSGAASLPTQTRSRQPYRLARTEGTGRSRVVLSLQRSAVPSRSEWSIAAVFGILLQSRPNLSCKPNCRARSTQPGQRGKLFRFGSLVTCKASLEALKLACCPQPRQGGNGSPRMTVTSCVGTWFRSCVTT